MFEMGRRADHIQHCRNVDMIHVLVSLTTMCRLLPCTSCSPLPCFNNRLWSTPSTGVLPIAGAEMKAACLRTLKLIWVIPAERGGSCFSAHRFLSI